MTKEISEKKKPKQIYITDEKLIYKLLKLDIKWQKKPKLEHFYKFKWWKELAKHYPEVKKGSWSSSGTPFRIILTQGVEK
jgi:hypothetical protein